MLEKRAVMIVSHMCRAVVFDVKLMYHYDFADKTTSSRDENMSTLKTKSDVEW